MDFHDYARYNKNCVSSLDIATLTTVQIVKFLLTKVTESRNSLTYIHIQRINTTMMINNLFTIDLMVRKVQNNGK